MRRPLLLAALCMVGALVFAPAAMAQSSSAGASASASASASAQDDLNCGQLSEAEEQAVFAADPSDPNGLDADDDGVPCEDDTTDDGSYAAPTEETVVDETMMEPTSVEPTMTEGSMMMETSAMDATAEADDGESATASASAEVEDLPDTSGAASPAALTVLPALLLVGAGILSVAVLRRN